VAGFRRPVTKIIRGLSVSMEPEPVIFKPRANQPCKCGAKWPDGNPKKYKHCCGRVSRLE
jgi:hypothetical protein